MPEPALRCEAVTVQYSGVPALDGVDLTVAPGELLALLGASGSGKSTLLHVVAGLLTPSAGEIWLGGERVASPRKSTPPERRNVGLVFQDFALWPHLTAVDTVAYPMRRAGVRRRAARALAQQTLDQLDIGVLGGRRPAELSGGEQQRVGLARALTRDPQLFLLDEPTAHLDTHLRAAFQDLVRDRQARSGAAAIYATHDAAEALALADRVALMADGRLIQVGSPQLVYERPVSAAAAVLTGAASVISTVVSASPAGSLTVELDGAPVAVPDTLAPSGPARSREVLLRPEWVGAPGPLRSRVIALDFRGAHTDYRLDTAAGPVLARLPGPPRHAVGELMAWGIRRAWVFEAETPAELPAQPSAVIAPG